METTKELQKQPVTTKSLFAKDEVKKKFDELLGKKAQGFITSVLQIVSQNAMLKNADPVSVYNAASVAATMDLPLNSNLGFAYIIPYNQKFKDADGQWKSKQVAQMQIGYKGFIQLAQRSGQFKTISAAPIYEGQLIESNPLTGFVFDFTKKASEKVIGYASYFHLLNGFEKTLFMTVDEIKKHGGKYSKTFKNENGLWNTDFEGMATKTVIKLLLSKFAPLSIEMQRATIVDQSVVNDENGDEVSYVDVSEQLEIKSSESHESDRMLAMVGDCKTIAELNSIQKSYPEMVTAEIYNQQKTKIDGRK